MKPLRLLGHPLHPVSVHLPIGLLLAASGLDLWAQVDANPLCQSSAQWALIAGLLSASLAICTGFIDFLAISDEPGVERAAFVHLGLISAALSLYGGSLGWRLAREFALGPALLSLGGAVVLMAAGWFGGHLVYHHAQGIAREGVDHEH